eukprot:CAMPEP_0174322614 /NCGR_PEP_ID=MMETSP0810-20121108/11127_1 /TAXON_ID=73025 ORGANISM="Eutreptiella gymnastica-like, Strain CCMP1594" /NCGR_SAMPLE_ID=MMETSP0810 /ASSEMBLY_ACC=CAM_ASM_000659 /LENGTH=58 /DNA_ID=CAMNT_0015434505 /DNA_START=776 /DNA_END=952 /DNA_ORIENTATION=-
MDQQTLPIPPYLPGEESAKGEGQACAVRRGRLKGVSTALVKAATREWKSDWRAHSGGY